MSASVASFDPDLYRLLHRGNPGDVRFYVDACRGSEAVLELGCGDGRVLRAVAAAGSACVGIDRSAGMLAAAAVACAGLDVQLVQGDMARFHLGRTFDRVLIPYNAIYCLADDAAVAVCLERARAHLADGGQLLLDAYVVDPDALEEDDAPEWVVQIEHAGHRFDVYEHMVVDRPARCLEITYLHVDPRAIEATTSYRLRHHWIEPDRLERMISAAGLDVTGRWRDFDRRPSEAGAQHMVLRAERSR